MEQQGFKRPDGAAQAFPGAAPRGRALRGRSDWRGELRDAIVSRVLPRLAEADEDAETAPTCPGGPPLSDEDVASFSEMALATAVPGLVGRVDALRRRGIGLDAVALQLLAPAARRLGDLWVADRLSFVDVTVALGRLQAVVRALGAEFDGTDAGSARGRTILLAPVSGEQHTFGLSLVAAFFRRAGWGVAFEPRLAFDDLLARARSERFTAIGLSVANDRHLALLSAQVDALRRASLARDVKMLAGGPAFLLDPGLRDRLEVDAVAADAAEAVRLAAALLHDERPVRAAS